MSALPGRPQASHLPVAPRGDLSWRNRARCEGVDPERFFPRKSDEQKETIKFCLGCPVRIECLQYALDVPAAYGIWGGTTQEERHQLRKRRRIA
ncbi:WhiB family transcriptional regulator [Mycobacterium intracellulare]|uniref:Transcriptional regulator WhiB n=1 Tax=Mycobacterium intracellulare TaxID=1767 RepID=A0AAE4UAV5_MYCIT|nr:WhiB family transcriptional regulator [Mycobacterium intracellulare]MDV6979616.1 WhiB family transcriptional regulator [Mycobacterium intracellulare]MDV6985119.1 WhiB family transcriptional regulator [Mycobacterium intracellulare]MDV7014261.1 WhiB family transcriptional regulator [Mycobacterium intracellulare]MDV7030110.1 WhiB family transcriptional regulator [Mycobacterium intracellulare]